MTSFLCSSFRSLFCISVCTSQCKVYHPLRFIIIPLARCSIQFNSKSSLSHYIKHRSSFLTLTRQWTRLFSLETLQIRDQPQNNPAERHSRRVSKIQQHRLDGRLKLTLDPWKTSLTKWGFRLKPISGWNQRKYTTTPRSNNRFASCWPACLLVGDSWFVSDLYFMMRL